jgi:hypothetical protein
MVDGQVPGKHSKPQILLTPAVRLQAGLVPEGLLLVQLLSTLQ